MTQRILTAAKQAIAAAKKVLPYAACGFLYLNASPAIQRWILWQLAVTTALMVGWYITSKASNKRWEAKEPERRAASLARCRATVEAHFAREEARAAAAAADPNWFNHDGPYTIAGQPR